MGRMNDEHALFLRSIAEKCEWEGLVLYIVERSDVSTAIVSDTYAESGWLVSHNAWYLQEVWVLDLQRPELGKQFYSDIKDVEFKR